MSVQRPFIVCYSLFCDQLQIIPRRNIYIKGGLELTRETPPGECGRKVKLKGIDGDLYKGWRCGLIRIPRNTLPIFVSGMPSRKICRIVKQFDICAISLTMKVFLYK